MKLYKLADDGVTPIETSVHEWALTFDPADPDASVWQRQIAHDTVGNVDVSTVFIGIDYSFGRDATPRCWETMIFGGENDNWQRRYNSHADALVGHRQALRYVKRGLPIP